MTALAMGLAAAAAAQAADPRLREITYDPGAVVTVPVQRGVVTLIVLDGDETITDVAAGLGSDCSKPEQPWCVATQAGGRTLFVKAKSSARAPNTLAVVTDRRMHSFRFLVLDEGDARVPVYRLTVRAAAPMVAAAASGSGRSPSAGLNLEQLLPLLALATPRTPPPPSPSALVNERLQAQPQVVNTAYSMAEGAGSADIVPDLVFDDGRFTYLRFTGNRELPAVFHVLGDGSESLVNARMEGDLLVVDRVSRRLMLRAGSAVVGLWNEAFDLDGAPPVEGTTVPGVRRVLRAAGATTARAGGHHE
jgi:type IV secretion system protein VirB9